MFNLELKEIVFLFLVVMYHCCHLHLINCDKKYDWYKQLVWDQTLLHLINIQVNC